MYRQLTQPCTQINSKKIKMKKIFSVILPLVLAAGAVTAQNGGGKWSVTGNNTSSGDFLGTTNSTPLIFKTNSQQQMSISPSGQVQMNSLAGFSSRLLQVDVNGNLIPLPVGTPGQVLYGNGVWGDLPAAQPLLWDLDPASGEMFNTSVGGMSVNGATRFNGNVNIASLSSSSSVVTTTVSSGSLSGGISSAPLSASAERYLYVDAFGNLVAGRPAPASSWECIAGTPSWNIGGNNFSGLGVSYPGLFDANIGTCDNYDFILKANDLKSVWIKTDGKVGVGTSVPQTEFHVTGNALFTSAVGAPVSAAFVRGNNGNSTASTPDYTWWNNDQAGFFHPAADVIGFSTGGLERMRIHSNGFVGVGTNNPLAKLEVSDGTNNMRIYGNNAGDITSSGSFRPHFATGTDFAVWEGPIGGPPNASLRFILKNGRAGIGSNNPEDRLQVGDDYTKVVMGSSAGQQLNYGTGYIGFNASRQNPGNTGASWTTGTDFSHNGGGAIWGDVFGNMFFATIPHTSTAPQTNVSDATVMNNAHLRILASGQVRIGNKTEVTGPHTDYKLSVDGKLVAKSCYITLNDWADYVFDASYKLPDLAEVESFYKTNKHLPEIPSESEIKEKGVDVAEMNKLLLKKVEELTIYLVEQQKEIDILKKQVNK
jgi:hypothetical protein